MRRALLLYIGWDISSVMNAGVRGNMCRFVRRSLTPRIARPISASVVPVNLAVFSGVERSKTGVQVSGMRTG